MTAPGLAEAVHAGHGIICAVGAGGKKTLLYHLLENHPGRAAMTTTVFTYQPPRRLAATLIVDDETGLRRRVPATEHTPVLYARPSDKAGRLAGVSADALADIHGRGGFGITVVKADGARMRLVKAPREDEPVIPACADVVLLVSSVHALARPLDERIAHRLDRVLALTGMSEGQLLTPAALARLYTHPEGLARGCGAATPVPVLNMVDGPTAREAAEETARHILANGERYDRVVLTSNRAPGLLVDVIRRS